MVDNECPQFYPPKLWGLNYQFSVYNKMYIADVVSMPEYPQFSGTYCYNNHPIYKVDVLGTVVKRSENSKCFMYAVDDGTGVILCCCWKENLLKPTVYSSALTNLPASLMDKVREIQVDSVRSTEGYSLGDMLHVKGKVNVFRDQKEIVANYHNKVDNAMFQPFWMEELPRLYRFYFDKLFQPPKKVQTVLIAQQQQRMPMDGTSQDGTSQVVMLMPMDGTSQAVTKEDLKNIIFNYISQREHLIELDPNDLLKFPKVKDMFSKDINIHTERALPMILQALSSLEDEGLVTRRSDRRMLYEVLIHRSKFERRILRILSEEAVEPKYSMIGCHYLHVVDELHKTYQYAKVKREAVMYCLQKLESQSDVIRTTHACYLPCSF